MESRHIQIIADELRINKEQVSATYKLISDGATVPFIARYRKELTGTLDEVAITTIRDRMSQLEELDKRRNSILKSLKERELLTDEIESKIINSNSLTNLEDIYLPFRPKRRTKASIAREKGLEPLAKIIFEQDNGTDPAQEARRFIDSGKGLENIEEALSGSRDIIAEWINEDQNAREKMRDLYFTKGVFRSKIIEGKEEDGIKFRDYFDLEEPISAAPSHRVLAMRRGEKVGFLSIKARPSEDEAISLLESIFIKGNNNCSMEMRKAIADCYKRLLSFSMETEVRLATKVQAEEKAIKVFSDNLRELLLAAPLGEKNVMAIDPGIRTGCKIACLDRQGKLLKVDTIYPFKSEAEKSSARKILYRLFTEYETEAIAVGNGTGGRETVSFIEGLDLPGKVPLVMVNESGASVYSASEVARSEFPELDVSFRGAVSIGRRLMDPLAEIVKIDPKSIGVGQYQHDVNQQALKKSLDDVVISCVNAVGVEINTASEQLLMYVSGLGPQLARNIILFRNENGALRSKEDLKKVPRLGSKAFELASGFLRIRNAENPLDASAVHPESYGIVEKMASDLNCTVRDVMQNGSLRSMIELKKYITDRTGFPTLTDILEELSKPGRDPREKFGTFEFATGINTISDLIPGMKLPGIVTNITAFGAFVDIGVHQDGLLHVSKIADTFVKDPHDVLKVQQPVTVTILDIDLARKRISLSMKGNKEEHSSEKFRNIENRPESRMKRVK
ncbi:MAG: RNA-binding transcriptional accessory protein [Deltaproteobacteria bacterium]|nr:RNA-binding transcriptional accessory protein [Deltaproteobacteria bacterium]